MKSRSRHNSKNKGFMIFFTMTLQPFIKYHSTPCFPSRNITKNAETHAPPTLDVNVIIEQNTDCNLPKWAEAKMQF